MPIVEQLENYYAGRVKIGKVNATQNRMLCAKLRVLSLPTFLLYKGGVEIKRITGDKITKSELKELMENIGFQVKGSFVSKKEDWELYIKPVNLAMIEIIDNDSELAEEAQLIINSFKAEYDAVNRY